MLLFLLACKGEPSVDDSTPSIDSDPLACDVAVDADCDGANDDVDCGPTDKLTFPGAPEIPYDGKDNDCAGDGDLTDVDEDGFDGTSVGGDDCNDSNPNVFPGAEEVCYNGIDEDCGGGEDTNDCDGDGFDGRGTNTTDCDDEDPLINPEASEIWYDGIDEDCSGYLDSDYDADGDGDDSDAHEQSDGTVGTDCDDSDPETAGGLPERWDAADRDCDSLANTFTISDATYSWYGQVGVYDGWMGYSAALMDDYDGDGLRTLAIAGYSSESANYPGRAYLLDMDSSGGKPAEVRHAVIDGDAGTYMGMDMANVGDLDGDGWDELLIGAPGQGSGSALLFLGSDLATGGALTADSAHAVMSGGDLLGFDTAGAGDMDGDGIPDIAGGVGWFDIVHVTAYSGATALEGGSLKTIEALFQVDGVSTGGQSLGGVDLDADGAADLIIGGATAKKGTVGMVSGASTTGGLGAVEYGDLPLIWGSSETDQNGITTGWLNDIDTNGYPELVVRTYGDSATATGGGRLTIVDGSTFSDGAEVATIGFATVEGTITNGHLQSAERGADVDGDGVEDLLVSMAGDRAMAWSLDGSTGVRAASYIHLGTDLALGGSVDANAAPERFRYNGKSDDDLSGFQTILEDVDGDGLPDAIFTAPAANSRAGSAAVMLNESR